jgi:hypothetical protein
MGFAALNPSYACCKSQVVVIASAKDYEVVSDAEGFG